jgi:hypothetical protein
MERGVRPSQRLENSINYTMRAETLTIPVFQRLVGTKQAIFSWSLDQEGKKYSIG